MHYAVVICRMCWITQGRLEAAWQAAQAVSDDVESKLLTVKDLMMQLELIKTATTSIFDRVLPSMDYIRELARNINASIFPEIQVTGIVANATASQQIAQQALELAQSARYFFHSAPSSTFRSFLSCSGRQ